MAKYVQGADRGQPMLLPPSIDDYIGADSPLRALEAFVGTLDLAALGFAVRDDGSAGRSSYDPATLLKLYLWGYLKRTRSSRGLEEACGSNLGAIWLTGDLRPDHSTISDFRKDHAAALKGVFREFNIICLQLGLFGRELVGIDGTFVKAVNSRARSFTKAKLSKLIERIDKAVGSFLERLDSGDAEGGGVAGTGPGEAELRRKIAEMKERRRELEAHLAECGDTATGQVNLTDPDSRQLCKGDKRTVGYNAQIAVDEKHHLVASCELTQEPSDQRLLNEMAQKAKEGLGLPPDARLHVLADSGYATGAELAACEANNTVATAPPQKTRAAGAGTYTEADFEYDAAGDSYTCPNGAVLGRRADNHRNKSGSFRVYHNAAACRGCPLKEKCTSGRYRQVIVSSHKEALDAARKRVADDPGAMRRRGALAEHPFGTFKDRNGRADLLCKGLELAGAETSLGFWGYNFTRVIRILGVEGLVEALRARPRWAGA